MSDRNHVVSPFEVEFLLGLYYGSSRRPEPCRALDSATERFTREGLIDSPDAVRLTSKGKEYVKAILNTPIDGVYEAPASAKKHTKSHLARRKTSNPKGGLEMKEIELVQECARYRMALEVIALLGPSLYQTQDIARAALEGAAPTAKADQPVPVTPSEPWA